MKWKIHQMDFKTTFLNGVVEEEVYVEKPIWFETHDIQTRVQIEEGILWFEIGTQDMVRQYRWNFDELGFYQE